MRGSIWVVLLVVIVAVLAGTAWLGCHAGDSTEPLRGSGPLRRAGRRVRFDPVVRVRTIPAQKVRRATHSLP